MGIMRSSFYNTLKDQYKNVLMIYGYKTKNTRIKNSKYPVAIKSFFQPEYPMNTAFLLCSIQILQKVKWCPIGAQANKQGYEQQHEVMKRNKLFDISLC